PYRHQPLDTSNHVRILHLVPGDSEEWLLCTIEHVELGDARYDALSSVLGSPKAQD
ncbi:hypothetical protein K432DRAFT_300801, partial [Lepidopterella palustris CBS 459.81]